MGITDVLVIIALVIAIIEEFRSKAMSYLAWSVILICAALLWHLIPT